MHYIFILLTELPAVVTKLKAVIEKVTFQTSTPASTWSTLTSSVESPVSACVSPQVVSDDMVTTSHAWICYSEVCIFTNCMMNVHVVQLVIMHIA